MKRGLKTPYTRAELQASLLEWGQHHWQGIPGVLRLDAPQPGPMLGIMAMTHGNEPAGLAALRHLLNAHQLVHQLQKGTVFLILNNLAAAERYFKEAQDLNQTGRYRFIDRDMNRMPEALDLREVGPESDYELQRVRALLPIYEQLEAVLDLHSTTAESEPMLIEVDPHQAPLYCPGVKVLIRHILPHLQGRALVELCPQAQGYVVECGSHENPTSQQIAIQATWRMLEQLEMVPSQPVESQTLELYEIFYGLILPDETYRLVRLFEAFEFLPRGTLLATGAGPEIYSSENAYVIMPSKRLQPLHPGLDMLFLARKIP